ncbi:MAG: UbiD family decarboxylase [Chloroflexi bacterium]|nr:UbiD family decarboxylase [Chloroflexota bacterium]
MKFDSLRDYIDEINRLGELKIIEGADWNLEIGAITELVAERQGPALLFDRIKDYPAGFRVLTNAFSSVRRTALVHGLPTGLTPVETLKAWRERMEGYQPVPPVEVKDGPVKENILKGEDIDLFKFPTPKWHEHDGGRYIGTGCAVITRDPDDGWINLGCYRGVIQDRNLMTIKINLGKHGRLMMSKYHARGESCPVAVAVGQEPTLFAVAADMAIRGGVGEYEYAGWMRGAPVEVVKGEATDLPVPATAEIVIEGEIPPPPFEPLSEGPFGEWTGYTAELTQGVHPTMKVKAILHRNDPIILGVPPLKPPIPYDFAIPKKAAGVWEQIEKADIPGIKGVWFPPGFSSAAILAIAVEQQYPGHAKMAALVGSACRAGTYGGRITIVVDDDIDVSDIGELMWAVATRCKAEEVDIVRGLWTAPTDPRMDPEDRNKNLIVSSRIIINACRPWDMLKDFPPVNRFSDDYRKKTLDKWSDVITG